MTMTANHPTARELAPGIPPLTLPPLTKAEAERLGEWEESNPNGTIGIYGYCSEFSDFAEDAGRSHGLTLEEHGPDCVRWVTTLPGRNTSVETELKVTLEAPYFAGWYGRNDYIATRDAAGAVMPWVALTVMENDDERDGKQYLRVEDARRLALHLLRACDAADGLDAPLRHGITRR